MAKDSQILKSQSLFSQLNQHVSLEMFQRLKEIQERSHPAPQNVLQRHGLKHINIQALVETFLKAFLKRMLKSAGF